MATDASAAAAASLPAQMEPRGKFEDNKMLDAWYDPLAQSQAFSQCIRLSDIDAMGEAKLLMACRDRKLRVYSGGSLTSEHVLLDDPVAMCVYYTDNRRPHTPAVAVAAGRYVFIYRNLRPYFKFSLPSLTIADEEAKVWAALKEGKMDIMEASDTLSTARDAGVELTMRSAELLALENPDDAADYVETYRHKPLQRDTVITAMASINKDNESIGSVGCLVIGTEAKEVMILSPSGSTIVKRCVVPSVPVKMVVTGLLDIDYRILCACRDGRVYTLRNLDSISTMKLEVSGNKIELDSQVVSLVSIARQCIIGCMNRQVHCYHIKGKKLWTMYMPDDIVCMEQMEVAMVSIIRALVVALRNGEVRVYHNKTMVLKIPPKDPEHPDPCLGVRFGRYGREDGCLIMSHVSGAVTVKILPRRTNFNIAPRVGPPKEQDTPLSVPKKTRLYVEQTQREREQAISMHRVFQRDLCRLRLDTARAYVKMITDGHGPSTFVSGASVRIDASVAGLGPKFHLQIQLRNTGSKAVANLLITVAHSHSCYTISPSVMPITLLLPSQVYHHEMQVTSITDDGRAEPIRVLMLRKGSAIPLLTAVVDMPMSMTNEE